MKNFFDIFWKIVVNQFVNDSSPISAHNVVGKIGL